MAEDQESIKDHWRTVQVAVKDFSNYRDIFLKNMAGESQMKHSNQTAK